MGAPAAELWQSPYSTRCRSHQCGHVMPGSPVRSRQRCQQSRRSARHWRRGRLRSGMTILGSGMPDAGGCPGRGCAARAGVMTAAVPEAFREPPVEVFKGSRRVLCCAGMAQARPVTVWVPAAASAGRAALEVASSARVTAYFGCVSIDVCGLAPGSALSNAETIERTPWPLERTPRFRAGVTPTLASGRIRTV
jgi:hypothetical protein